MAKAIGVFDSGIGGLTVASAIKRRHPEQRIVYFGDTAHLPYGDKSAENIEKYIKAISAFLFSQECDQLVVACNSASSVLSKVDLNGFSNVLNVIDPVVQAVSNRQKLKRVGVIGTKRTIESNVYLDQLTAKNPTLEIHQLATPLLAPMIEEGFVHDSIAEKVIQEYLSEMPEVDALILGCTHYPLIRKEIDAYFDGQVLLFDAPELVAQGLGHADDKNQSEEDVFYVSDYTESFEKTAKQFFGKRIQLLKSDLFDH